MKKILLLSATALVFTGIVSAQLSQAAIKTDEKALTHEENTIKKEKKEERKELRKLKGSEVSESAKLQFYTDFGDIKGVTWRRGEIFDVAMFTQDGAKQSAYYGYDHKLVGTTTKKTFADLPKYAQQYIDKQYKGYTKEAVLLYDDNEANESDMVLYGRQFDDEDSYFIELAKDGKTVVLQSTMDGVVTFFKSM